MPEGELVTFSSAYCDGEDTDGPCGCRRSLSGVDSSSATTTMKVAVLEGGRSALEQAIRTSLTRGRWPPVGLRSAVDQLIAAAAQFPVGTVVEWRDGTFRARVTERDG